MGQRSSRRLQPAGRDAFRNRYRRKALQVNATDVVTLTYTDESPQATATRTLLIDPPPPPKPTPTPGPSSTPAPTFTPSPTSNALLAFIDDADASSPNVLSSAVRGDQVGLEVIDANLNVSVKRVLLPTDMAAISGTVSTVSGSVTVTGSGTAFCTTATTSDTVIGPGDTVLVGDETVRQVISVGSATQLTVNKPFTVDAGGATLSKVIVANGSASNCPTCAAPKWSFLQVGPELRSSVLLRFLSKTAGALATQ